MDEATMLPPPEWFANPGLPGPTPLTVQPDGRVFGHIADWQTPHIGLSSGQTAPRSRSGYRYFRTGAVLTSGGAVVPVGHLTVGTGHASTDPGVGVTAAAEHYDNTGTAVADVAVGEDEHGIWCAGMVRPGSTPEQVHALRASSLSGDWRDIDGAYELVAALGVNTPGFPIPRIETPALAASGRPRALLALGMVQNTERTGTVAETVEETPTPPAGPAATESPQAPPPGSALLAAMREHLGLGEDVDEAAIVAALAEDVGRPRAAQLPEGVVAIDQEQLTSLQASAARGEEARRQQEREQREALVASAVSDGRIPPARREHWLAQLSADPGAGAVLASLAPGLVPLEPKGHDAEATPDPGAQDDYWFPGVVSTTSSREG